MRQIFFYWLLLSATTLFGQQTPDCQDMLRQAKRHERDNELSKAVQFYLNALNCNSALGAEIGPRLKSVFEKIEEQKRQEIRARKEAEQATRTTYANDLAFKSQTALREGDRTTAFRLAELAYNYVDKDNPNVAKALMEAMYYNENLAHEPLAWIEQTLEGRNQRVSNVAFSPDGKTLAAGYSNYPSYTGYTVKLWDIESHHVTLSITLPRGVSNVAFSPDGKLLAIAAADSTATLWDIALAKKIQSLKVTDHNIPCVAFSPEGTKLLTQDANATMVWDLSTGQVVLSLKDNVVFGSNSFSPDGKQLVTESTEQLKASIWDIESGKEIQTFTLPNWASKIEFASNGKKVLACYFERSKVNIWNILSNKLLISLDGQNSYINKITISPDGTKIATASLDQVVKIWNAASGKTLFICAKPGIGVRNLVFSPDGKKIATNADDTTIRIWNIDDAADALVFKAHNDFVNCVAFSPDGAKLATGSFDHTVKIWDLRNGKNMLTLSGHKGKITALTFSQDGKYIVSGADDKAVKGWDLASGREIFTVSQKDNISNLVYSTHGKTLAIGSYNEVKIWDQESEKNLYGIKTEGFILSSAISSDGTLFATGASDSIVRVWDIYSGKNIYTFLGSKDFISSLAFSPDKKFLAAADGNGTVKIWDLASQKNTVTLRGHHSYIKSLAFSPDGKWLASGSTENVIKIWDVRSGKNLFSMVANGDEILDITFSPDGKKLAACFGYRVQIWELTPAGWYASPDSQKPLSGLLAQDLNRYEILNLLDIFKDNEVKLLQSNDFQQIIEFAALYDQKTYLGDDLRRNVSDFSRAARLYRYALSLKNDSSLTKALGQLYQHWAENILISDRPDTAVQYIKTGCQLCPDNIQCPKLCMDYELKSGKEFDFQWILSAEDAAELRRYGDYFFKKEKYPAAWQLYEKAERKAHTAKTLKNLYDIAAKTGNVVDFNRFLSSENPDELTDYGDFFYYKRKWPEARQLFEKAAGKKQNLSILRDLCKISEKTGENIDLNHFIKSSNVGELNQYFYFFFDNIKTNYYLNQDLKIFYCQNAARIGEKLLRLDSTSNTREHIARVYYVLSYYQLQTGDGNAVEANARRSVELAIKDKSAIKLLGPALLLQNRFEEAKKEFLYWAPKKMDDKTFYRDYFIEFIRDDLRSGGFTIPRLDEIEALLISLNLPKN